MTQNRLARTIALSVAALIAASLSAAYCSASTNDLIAYYPFKTNGYDALGQAPPFVFTNLTYTGGVVYVNGFYEPNGHFVNHLATDPLASLRYDSFAVSLDFCPQPIRSRRARLFRAEVFLNTLTRGFYAKLVGYGGNDTHNILTGGQYYRWIGFNRENNLLNLSLNNRNLVHEFVGARVKANQLHHLACSLDLARKQVLTYFDGVKLEPIKLPADFKLEVIGSAEDARDREFGFADYSNGSVYAGYAANFRVFDRALTDQELAQLGSGSFSGWPVFKRDRSFEMAALTALALITIGLLFLAQRFGVLHRSSDPEARQRR